MSTTVGWVQQFAALFLAGADRDQLDPILDTCAATYIGTLDEDQQVDFKGKAKVFCRTYDFLASVMPGTNAEWEKLSILLNLLVSKLPAPKEEDLAKGILEAIDMDSYRVEKKALMKIALADTDAEIAPVPTEGGGRKPEPELDRLSNILKSFNESFGTLFEESETEGSTDNPAPFLVALGPDGAERGGGVAFHEDAIADGVRFLQLQADGLQVLLRPVAAEIESCEVGRNQLGLGGELFLQQLLDNGWIDIDQP